MAIKSPKESKADVLHQAASDMKLETNETSMCVPLGPPDDICLCYHVNADLCEGNHYLSDQSVVSGQPAKASLQSGSLTWLLAHMTVANRVVVLTSDSSLNQFPPLNTSTPQLKQTLRKYAWHIEQQGGGACMNYQKTCQLIQDAILKDSCCS